MTENPDRLRYTNPMAVILNVEHLRKHFTEDPVLVDVTFQVRDGDKIGLVGPNGCGKTTLLNILAGKEELERGSIERQGDVSIGYLEQRPEVATGRTVLEEAQRALAPLLRMQEEAEEIAHRLAAATDQAEHDRLAVQFERALCHGRGLNTACTPEKKYGMEQLGSEKAIALLDALPEIRRTLALDVEAAFAGDPACRSLDEVIFCYPGLEAITIHRLAHAGFEDAQIRTAVFIFNSSGEEKKVVVEQLNTIDIPLPNENPDKAINERIFDELAKWYYNGEPDRDKTR